MSPSSSATLPPEACERLWRYCVHGGLENATECLRYIADLIGDTTQWREPAPLARAGQWHGITSRQAAGAEIVRPSNIFTRMNGEVGLVNVSSFGGYSTELG